MMPPVGVQTGSDHWHARCLLVRPAEQSDDISSGLQQLISSLTRRGLTVSSCVSCFDAMAELTNIQRERRAGRNSEPVVVVLVCPERIAHVVALHEAALKYAPGAVFWQFQDGGALRLTAYHGPGPVEPSVSVNRAPPSAPMVARGAPAAASERAPLRLTPEADSGPLPLRLAREADDTSAKADAAHSLLTDEELSMLLGEGFVEGSSGGARA